MNRALLQNLLPVVAVAALGLHPLPGALAQTAPKPFDPSQREPEPWINLPEIVAFANADGSLDVAWRDYTTAIPKIYLTRFARTADGYTRTGAEELPSLGVLAGFTKDEQGNVYHMTAEKGDGEARKRMVLYKNKQPFWTFKVQDGDKPCEDPKLPLDGGTAQLVTGAGKLFVDVNLLPGHAHNVILDLENPALNATRCARETLYHHNFDQRVLFDGTDFLAIENRDHEVTLSMMKFSPAEKYPFEPYAERLRSVYARTNNGNSIFTELGDIAPGVDNGNGYLVLFASERDWDNQMDGLNKRGEQTGIGGQIAPRDLAVIHVRKDFDRQDINWKSTPKEMALDGMPISQSPKLVDATVVVNSLGTGKTVNYKAKNDGWDWPNYNAQTAQLIASGDLAERQYKTGGVNWLTTYGVPFEAARQLPAVGKPFATVVHPKLVRLAPNSYIALWEEWSGARATWDKMMTDKTYQTTRAMALTLAAEGANVRINPGAVKDLGKIRVMAFDDAFNLAGKAAWVTGDETTKSLKLNLLDAGLNYQAFSLPLAGDLRAMELRANLPDTRPPQPQPQVQPPPQIQPPPLPPLPPQADQFNTFKLDGIAINFPRDWTNTRDIKFNRLSSISPDKTARLYLKSTNYASFDPLQENMEKEIFAPLFPGLRDLAEVDTQHDISRGGLALRVVTYTANLNGKPVNIIVEFAKPPTDDAAKTVLLIRCVDDGVSKYDDVITQISASLRRAVN